MGTIEYRVKHKEGHYIPVFAKGSLVKINDKLKIVELHGGEIWVESEGRNKGAKFSFSLPNTKE